MGEGGGREAYTLLLILPCISVRSFFPLLQPLFRFILTDPMLLNQHEVAYEENGRLDHQESLQSDF
jgi:hypothetical protein